MKKLLLFVCISILFANLAYSKEPRSKDYFKKNPDSAAELIMDKCSKFVLSMPPKDSMVYKECVNAEKASKERNAEIDALDYCAGIYKQEPATSIYFRECKRIQAEIKANKWDSRSEWSLLDGLEFFIRNRYPNEFKKEKEENEKQNAKRDVLGYCKEVFKSRPATGRDFKECKRIETEIKEDKWNISEWNSYNGLETFISDKYAAEDKKEKEQREAKLAVIPYCANTLKTKFVTSRYIKECIRISVEIRDNKWDISEWSKYGELDPFLKRKYGEDIRQKEYNEEAVMKYCLELSKTIPETSVYSKECIRIFTEIKEYKWDHSEFQMGTTFEWRGYGISDVFSIDQFIADKYGRDTYYRETGRKPL